MRRKKIGNKTHRSEKDQESASADPTAGGLINDVRLVAKNVIRPEPLYADRPLLSFVGRLVKIEFTPKAGPSEHMWIKIQGVTEDRLVGRLVSVPRIRGNGQQGDLIRLYPTQIEAIDLSLAEWQEEAEELRTSGDYFNAWRGEPYADSEFVEDYYFDVTPRQALTRWKNWCPATK